MHTTDAREESVRQGSLRTKGGRVLPLEKTAVRARIGGPIATVTVEQRFVNDTADAIEAVYLFPLPANASVYQMEFRIADRVVRAVVKEKGEARRAYELAKSEGRAATLLEEEASSLFTLSVANVPAGAAIDVTLGYEEVLRYDDGEHRFVYPMVAPERYREAPKSGATVREARSSAGLAPPRLPSGERASDVSVEIEVRADEHVIEKLRCTSHRIDVEPLDFGGKRVRLHPSETIPNRDFVLTFGAGEEGVRPVARYSRTKGGRGTIYVSLTPPKEGAVPRTRADGGAGELKALTCGNCGGLVSDLGVIREIPGVGPIVPCSYCGAMLAPSTEPIARASRPRDVVVLVDRSASMRSAMPQVRRAVRALLDGLDRRDAVQVFAFDHERIPFDGDGISWVGLSNEVVARVDRFLEGLAPRGGTELLEAIERVAKLEKREGRTTSVVLVTDAAVGNEGRVVRRASEILGSGRRLFVLGLGSVVDERLVERLARATGGASDVLGTLEDVEPVMTRFTRRVRAGGPVLTGLSLEIEGAEDLYPRTIPDLYGGQPVDILARFDATGPSTLVLTATTADGRPYRQEIDLALPAACDDTPALERLWAKRRVDALVERMENEPSLAAKAREEATEIALAHSLVTRFTSLVAEDSEVVAKGPPRRVDVETPEPGAPAAHGAPAEDGLASLEMAAIDHGFTDEELAEAPARPAMARARLEAEASIEGTARPMPPMAVSPAPPPMAMPAPPPAPSTYAPRGAMPAPRAPEAKGGLLAKAGALVERAFGGGRSAGPSGSQTVVGEPDGSDAYDAEELRWLSERASGELDLVFLVDETGSMGPYIEQVKEHLLALVAALRKSPLMQSLRIGVVTYRDHPPQDHTFASRTFALTADIGSVEKTVRDMQASGGGDGPESVTDGLFDVVRLEWRPNAARAVVWFGDAPPHGVEPSGDGFPQGCPCGNHWYTQAESCREMGIAVYAVGCRPNIQHYVGAEAVFRTVALTTRATYLPLERAHLLVPLMLGAAASELDKRRIDEHVADVIALEREALAATDEDERVRWVTEALRSKHIKPRDMGRAPEGDRVAPLKFRDVEAEDVRGALDRLRSAGRLSL